MGEREESEDDKGEGVKQGHLRILRPNWDGVERDGVRIKMIGETAISRLIDDLSNQEDMKKRLNAASRKISL